VTEESSPSPVMLMVRTLGSGGTERQVTEIAKALDRDCFSPHVGCFEDDGFHVPELRACGVPVLRMQMRSFLSRDSVHAFLAMRRYFRKHGIRLVHTFDYPMNVFCAPAARLLRVPVVLSSQRSYRDLIPSKYIPMIRITDRLVDGIVVNCEAVRRHLREKFSVPDNRITTCYNAIDTSVFRPGGRQRSPVFFSSGPIVGTVCVLRTVKCVDTLIAAFANAVASHPDARLLIVGDGTEKEPLERQAAELGLTGKVLFAGATKDVAAWLRAIDIFVLPSESEALSNSLMEAMASGCCAIASRVGGNPELVSHGETGLLFEPGDVAGLTAQLISAIGDTTLRAKLSDAGSRYIAAKFSRERSISRIELLYREKLREQARQGSYAGKE
jgi:L-malate glycosyltransferase